MERTTAEIYQNLFVHRPDVYARQTAAGSYFLVRQPVDEQVIGKHLRGEITAGWYAIRPDSTTRWVCLDADRADGLAQLQVAWKALDRRGLAAQLERSRRGGHLWILFEPLPARLARRLVLGILPDLEGIEVFPKQDQLSEGGYGSLVRGPFGIHRRSGERYPFVDPLSLVPLSATMHGTLEYLAGVPRLGAVDVAEHLALLLDEAKRLPSVGPAFLPRREIAAGTLSAREVKDRIGDLRSFISRYVPLDEAGRGACPFHPPDTNASFSVHANGYWVCFHEVNPRTGRYVGGDAIAFYQRYRGLTFREALAELAQLVADSTSGPTRSPRRPPKCLFERFRS